MLSTVEKCVLCGGVDYSDLFVASDRLGDEFFQIKKCDFCGFCFVDPRPAVDDIYKYYPEGYWGGGRGTARLEMVRVFLKTRILRSDVKKITRYKKNGRVLDIGCSQGFFLKLCNALGFEAFGIEVSSEAREYATRKLGLDNIYSSFDELLQQNAKFDVITMWSVLEHMHDPDKTLQLCNKIMSDGGVLFVQVPNIESSQAIRFKGRWAGIDAPRHLSHFSPQTLSALLEKNGFDLLEENHFYNRHNLYTAVASRFNFLDEHRVGIAGSLMAIFLIKILKIIYYPFVSVENIKKQGATFYVVAQKKP